MKPYRLLLTGAAAAALMTFAGCGPDATDTNNGGDANSPTSSGSGTGTGSDNATTIGGDVNGSYRADTTGTNNNTDMDSTDLQDGGPR